MTFDRLIARIQEYDRNTERRVIELCKPYEPEIADLNTAQLERGEYSTGGQVEPPYRPLTKRIKRSKGQPTNRVTLKDEGDFHNSFTVRFAPGYFAIYATDNKAGKLERKYGKDIYGLSDDSRQELVDMVRPDMVRDFEQFVSGRSQ